MPHLIHFIVIITRSLCQSHYTDMLKAVAKGSNPEVSRYMKAVKTQFGIFIYMLVKYGYVQHFRAFKIVNIEQF